MTDDDREAAYCLTMVRDSRIPMYPGGVALVTDLLVRARAELRRELESARSLNELANEHALPGYDTDAVDALVVACHDFLHAPAGSSCLPLNLAYCRVRDSRKPPL